MSELAIYAVELGGEHCSAGYHANGETHQVVSLPTPQPRSDGPAELRDTIMKMVGDVANYAPPMNALAVSVSGFLNLQKKPGARKYGVLKDNEVVMSAPHVSGILNLPFFKWLEAANLRVPLHVENDVNAALRAATDHPTAVSINLGTGLAASIKRDNRIVHMPNTWSCYQSGHGFRWNLPDEMIRKCRCGSVGCLEAAIGAWSLTERYGVKPEEASADVYESMAADVVTLLTPAIIELVEKSGIENVILTGGAARGFDANANLAERLTKSVAAERPLRPQAHIDLIKSGDFPGLHGVALAALDSDLLSVPLGL